MDDRQVDKTTGNRCPRTLCVTHDSNWNRCGAREAPARQAEGSRAQAGADPNDRNGLTKPSQIMVDKPQTPLRSKLGPVFGDLDDFTMIAVNRALALFLGLA